MVNWYKIHQQGSSTVKASQHLPFYSYIFPIFQKKKKQICQTWYILISILALAFSGVKQKKLLIISSNKFDMISFVLTFLGLSFAAKLIIGMSTYWNQL